MSTNKTSTAKPAPADSLPPPPKTSPLRLIVLLGILAVAVGVLAYDYKIAGPNCEAGEKKIQEFVDARNKLGVKEGALVTAADVRKELGMEPTKIEKNDEYGYTVEYYSWWGNVPILNRRRHYISVVYIGQEPRHFSSSHRNSPPPTDALPIPEAMDPTADDSPLPTPQASTGGPKAPADADAPAVADEQKGAPPEDKAEAPPK